MTTGAPLCERCCKPVPDTAYVCQACGRALARALDEAAGIVEDAVATAARQARYGTGGRAAGDQMPFNFPAADAVWAAGNVLTTWARHVAETRGCGPGRPRPPAGPVCRTAHASCSHLTCQAIRIRHVPHPVARAARWLATQIDWLRHRREALEAVDELHDACALLRRTADRPPAHWYAGPCLAQVPEEPYQCKADLYALPGASAVRCRECGTGHDAGERREWLLREARCSLANATLIATALTALGLKVTPSMVWNYASRGRIVAHGQDERGRPVYNVGEVIDIVEELAARRADHAA
jgi:hypothetical protein